MAHIICNSSRFATIPMLHNRLDVIKNRMKLAGVQHPERDMEILRIHSLSEKKQKMSSSLFLKDDHQENQLKGLLAKHGS